MRSGGKNYNYFPENKLIIFVNFVQLIRTCMLMFCLEDWELGTLPPLGYATGSWCDCDRYPALWRPDIWPVTVL